MPGCRSRELVGGRGLIPLGISGSATPENPAAQALLFLSFSLRLSPTWYIDSTLSATCWAVAPSTRLGRVCYQSHLSAPASALMVATLRANVLQGH